MVGAIVPTRPVVTYTVIGLCALMFVLQLATGGAWTNRLAFWPAIGAVEPYRFLTASFLHSTSFMGHILFNMLAFWQCGQLLERAFGHWRFLAVCFVSALGGSVGFLLLSGGPGSTGWVTPVVGASGMVFGLFGALIPVLKTTGNSIRQILVLIAINGVLGFVVPGIAWQAHLGGLIMGIVVSLGYTKAAVKFQQIGAWALPLAATILLIGVGFIYYEATGWLPLLRFVAGA